MTSPPAFDRAAVLAHYGDAALLKQIAEVCIAEWPRDIERLRDAAAALDAKALRAAAHRTKGTFANFLAEPMVAAARRLETACAKGLPADHAALLEEVLRRGDEVVAALKHETGV